LGSGAHGWLDGVRYANAFPPQDYIARVSAGQSPRSGQYRPEREDEIAETMIMGLRLTREGVRDSRFRERFGESLEAAFGETISQLVRDGLLERTPDAIRLTTRGRLLGNVVFRAFV
jgi:oxygen-independent coproporphyrinogen-3 oxidase